MSLCKDCVNNRKDHEIGVALKPEDEPNEFRTWMICVLSVDGYPWKEECDQFEKA